MKVVFFLLLIVLISSKQPALTRKFIDELKSFNSTWKVEDLEKCHFKFWTLEELKATFGKRINKYDKIEMQQNNISLQFNDLPNSFDSREKWPSCIPRIKDLGNCGSHWAHGLAIALSERFCISKGSFLLLSTQDPVSCDYEDYACDGGYLDTAWSYAEKEGLVTEACFPYQSMEGKVPPCPNKKCKNSDDWIKYRCQENSVFNFRSIEQKKDEIMNKGPLENSLAVYEDLLVYSDGIYQHLSGTFLGFHSTTIIGWGQANNINFWILANSWGENWGEHGYLRIKQGECLVDQDGYGCLPS